MPKFDWNLITNFQTLDQYVETGDLLGSGTFGVVNKAWLRVPKDSDEGLTYLAIKKIRLPIKGYNPQIQACKKENDFLKEIVNHPNIMKVYFHFSHLTSYEKCYYVGMEYGISDLNSIIKHKGKFSENEVVAMAQQIWNGLQYLETINTAHRDLKPENIIMSEDGIYKLCDFGEVKFSMNTFKTLVQSVVGTPPYLAPEMFKAYYKNQAVVNYHPAKADTFSFGVVIVQALLGCGQFGIDKINQEEQTTKDLLQGRFSESLRWFLNKCLKFNPSERWTFSNMLDIFKMNPIEAFYKLELKQKEIQLLNQELNKYKLYEETNKKLEIQIKELIKQNEQLQKIIDLSKNQLVNQEKSFATHQNSQNKQSPIVGKAWTKYEVIEKCFQNLKQDIWKKSDDERKIEFFNNTQLKWSEQYKYKQWWDKGNSSAIFNLIVESDRDKARDIIQQLANETKQPHEFCLRIMHSNMWNKEKSNNDLMGII